MTNTRNLYLVILTIIGLVVFLVVAALLLRPGGALSGLLGSDSDHGDMRVFVQAPPLTNVGEEFSMLVTIYNDSRDYIQIEEIRLPLELLGIATVKSIFPGSLNQTDFDGRTTGFQIGYLIEPDSQREFEIVLFPRSSGEVIGELLVGSDSQFTPAGFRLNFEQPVVALAPSETVPAPPTPTASPEPPTPTYTPAGPPYQAVVKITAKTYKGNIYRIGSGTIISPDGLILTNAHIVTPYSSNIRLDPPVISITNRPDEPPVDRYLAEVLKTDDGLNIAVLHIISEINGIPVDPKILNLPYVTLGDPDQLELGDPLTILGYPIIGGDTITFTQGDVGGFTAEGRYGDRAFIKTSATIAAGASGGLALDQNGLMVAIPTQLGGGGDALVDCRILADTNLDGRINQKDSCIPVGGFINSLRPVNLGLYLIEAARISLEANPSP